MGYTGGKEHCRRSTHDDDDDDDDDPDIFARHMPTDANAQACASPPEHSLWWHQRMREEKIALAWVRREIELRQDYKHIEVVAVANTVVENKRTDEVVEVEASRSDPSSAKVAEKPAQVEQERRATRKEVLAQNKQEINVGVAEQVEPAASANKKHAAAQFQQSSPVTVTPPHSSVAEVGVATATTTKQTNVEESAGPSDIEDDDAAQKKTEAVQEVAHENSQQIAGSANKATEQSSGPVEPKKATDQSSAPVEQPALADATDVEDDHVDAEQNKREVPEPDDANRSFASEDNSSENQCLTSSEESEDDEDKKDAEEVDNDNLDSGVAYKNKTSILKKPENNQRAAEGHDQGEQQNDRRRGSPFPRRNSANNDDTESSSDVEAPPKNGGGGTKKEVQIVIGTSKKDGHNSRHSDRDENMNKRRHHSAAHFSPFDAKNKRSSPAGRRGESSSPGEDYYEPGSTDGAKRSSKMRKVDFEKDHEMAEKPQQVEQKEHNFCAAVDDKDNFGVASARETKDTGEGEILATGGCEKAVAHTTAPGTSAAPRDVEKRSRSDSCLSSSRSSPGSARSSSRSSRSSKKRRASRDSSSPRVCSNKRSCTDSNSPSRKKNSPSLQGTSSQEAPSAGPRRSSGKSVRLRSPSPRRRSIQRPQEGKNNKQPVSTSSRPPRRSSAPSNRPAPRRSIVKVSRWSCANRDGKEVAPAAAAAESSSRKKVFHDSEQPRKSSRKRRYQM